jgi:signal transduction histidine kinase
LDGIQRVARIVRAMKEFSHPDKGEKAPADINRALQTTLTIARNELKYVADVVTDFDESLPSVHCNLGGMNQVFLNILVNAAHAIADAVGDGSGGKGTITVSTRREDDSVVIAISDTGTGIPPQARDRVFDPFFTSKAVGRGTGQGLTIARAEVVDKHGGSITFDTEVGKGTTFYIRLPFHAPEPVEAS